MSEKMIVACPECQTRFVAPLEKFLPDGRKVRCAKCGHSWFHRVDTANNVEHDETGSASDVTPDSQPLEASVSPEEIAQSAPEASIKSAPAVSIMDRATQATEAQSTTRHNPQSVESEASNTLPLNTSSVAAATAAVGAGVAGVAASAKSEAAEDTVEAFDADDLSDESDFYEPSPISTGEPVRKRRSWLRYILYTIAAVIIAGALAYFFKDAIAKQVPALETPLTGWKNTVDDVVSNVVPAKNTLKIENVRYDITEVEGEKAMLLTAEVRNNSETVVDAPKLEATLFGADEEVLETVIVSPEEPVSEIDASAALPYYLRLPFPPEALERVEVDFDE